MHQFYLRVSALLALVADPVSAQDLYNARQLVVISDSVSEYTMDDNISVAPTLLRDVALIPVFEVEEVEGRPYPSLHFLDCRDNKNPPTHRRVSVTNLTSNLDVGGLEDAANGLQTRKLLVHSWDGKDTILVSYPEVRWTNSVWLVKLDAGVMGFLDDEPDHIRQG